MSPKRTILISFLIAIPITIVVFLTFLSKDTRNSAGYAYAFMILLTIFIAALLTKGRRIIHCNKKVNATITSREEVGDGTSMYLHLEATVGGEKLHFIDKDTNEMSLGNIGDTRVYYINEKDLKNIRKETRKADLIELGLVLLLVLVFGVLYLLHLTGIWRN